MIPRLVFWEYTTYWWFDWSNGTDDYSHWYKYHRHIFTRHIAEIEDFNNFNFNNFKHGCLCTSSSIVQTANTQDSLHENASWSESLLLASTLSGSWGILCYVRTSSAVSFALIHSASSTRFESWWQRNSFHFKWGSVCTQGCIIIPLVAQ